MLSASPRALTFLVLVLMTGYDLEEIATSNRYQ